MDARDLDIQGLKLRLWDHGGEGPTVLLLHGFLDTGRSFDAVAAALADEARVLALDWRGHGASDRVGAGGSYHLLDHVKDLRLVLARLDDEGLRPRVVAAHSMGGNAALILAGASPDALDRLVLLDALGPPAEPPEDQPGRIGRVLDQLEGKRPFQTFATAADAAARVRELNFGLTEVGAHRMVDPVVVDVEGGVELPFDPRLRGPTPVRYPEEMWRALCARVTAKVHVLRAEHGYVPDGEPALGRAAAMGALVTTLPGSHHHLHVDHPEAIADFLRSRLGPART
jgi:pimeloyl-ACP methyl ester carboxylesterase